MSSNVEQSFGGKNIAFIIIWRSVYNPQHTQTSNKFQYCHWKNFCLVSVRWSLIAVAASAFQFHYFSGDLHPPHLYLFVYFDGVKSHIHKVKFSKGKTFFDLKKKGKTLTLISERKAECQSHWRLTVVKLKFEVEKASFIKVQFWQYRYEEKLWKYRRKIQKWLPSDLENSLLMLCCFSKFSPQVKYYECMSVD